ncbi:MAG: DUF4160 domain-containing protein [Candidatus Sericytochromatia bacterium]|nr:DUF4160 domain-containing protein [Candidatus Tanganyikabacteria bacterium]
MGSWLVQGFKIVVRSREDARHVPHVHVFKAEHSAVIALGGPSQRPRALEADMWPRDLIAAIDAVASIQAEALAEWRRIHG